ncbi:NAD-binding lipoprotein [Streptomyces sp. TRM76323]|uniref:NAD-binding lipoprotein n=1 Tax=Streptomyces tamarix TaxID=3078565 RepID=A0ABU3QRQ8_9ACTN|nr:NAD-binding lipoprotein [Streptomyces tamarix]MDT9685422.1 NAD-binding lipoprotein [Streptomyces tamarix]
MARHASSARLRARYHFDNLIARGTPVLIGWLVLMCLAVVVPASIALVWTDQDAPKTLSARISEVWHRVGETLEVGGEVGSPTYVLLSVLLALVALLFVSTLVSLITTGINRRIMALRLGHSTVLEKGHTVLLGWSDQVFPVISELVVANANQRRSAVAVLAAKDKVEMESEIAANVGRNRSTRVICRTGSVTVPAVLARVSPHTAKAVLVLPPRDEGGDLQVVKTLLAVNAAVPRVGGDTAVIAAVRDARHHLAATLAAGPGGCVLNIDDVIARLLVQTSRQPGLSLVYQELLDFEGDEFYTCSASDFAGRTFGETLLSFATSSVVGVLSADGAIALNPPSDTRIDADDQLLVITRDDDTAVRTDAPLPVDEDAIVGAAVPVPAAEHLLLLGWNRRAPLIVEQLDQYVAPRSTLDVVALGTEAAVRDAYTADGTTRHLSVTFHSGDITEPRTLADLDVPSYDSVIVIGDGGHPAAPTGADLPGRGAAGKGPDPDDRTLLTLLHLRAIEESTGREIAVITEMSDDRNRPLAPVREGADFIVSGRLISLLMTQISENRHLADLFTELFAAEGSEIYLKPAVNYVRPGREVTFATVVESARRQYECAIGYRLHHQLSTAPDYGVRINPDKRRPVRFAEGDQVIVVAVR